MAIPAILITIAKFLGCKAVEKAVDVSLDAAINHKENKKTQTQLKDIQDIAHENNSLLQGLAKETSAIIRDAADELEPLIKSLHVNTAHQVLDNLRATVKANDRKPLSRIDFYRGCCSRYINKDQCLSEYNHAWQEMVDDGVYDPEIVGAKIYVHCINKDQNAAILAANKLKSVCRTNIWAWIPDLLFSEDLTAAYESLPQDIDRLLVLANSCMLGNNKKSLGVDINTYNVQLPENLTFDNIPLWSFNVSVLINRFFPEWNHSALDADTNPGEATQQLFDATTKLLTLQSKTELPSLLSDLDFWHAISGCQIDPTDELLNTLKNCTCSADSKEYRVIAYVNILSRLERYDEAKKYLNQTMVSAAVLNQRFLLSLQTADPQYAVETFKIAAATQVAFPGQLIIYALSSIKNFSEYVIQEAPKLNVERELDKQVYQQICKHFAGESVDIQFLLDNRNNFDLPYKPFVAIVLHANQYINEGLELMKSCMPADRIELVSCMYVDLLEQTPTHAAELYEYLRYVREDLGYTEIPRWIRLEYSLAARLSDFPRMLAVSKILHEETPSDPQFFICYLQSLVHAGDNETIKLLIEKLPQYNFNPSQVHFVYSQLVLAGYPQQAIELIYNACLMHPTNEELSMCFFNAGVNPSTAAIINQEYDEVSNGSYIHYTVNGESKTTLIDKANRHSFLIGHKKGETIEQPDWRGKTESFHIESIHNKYFQLSERIYKDIADNKYTAIKSIQYTDEELKSGSIIDELFRLTGQDQNYQNRHQQTLRQYKNGEMSLLAFLKDDSLVADLYNILFGDFKVYGFTIADFDDLYKTQETEITTLQPVLDLPSVILLYELERKFHFTIGQDFIVPRILVHHLEISLQNEMHGAPHGIYQRVVNRLVPTNNTESWLISRLKDLLAWINENAQIEDTSERLNQNQDVFKESQYLTLFYDCFSLVKPGRVLVCADKTMVQIFAKHVPVADINYLLNKNEQYTAISHFFMEVDLYGGNIDTDYVFGEYVKYTSGKPSWFPQCRENLQLCPNLYKVVIEVCDRISRSPIINAADNMVIEELMSSLFQSIGRKSSLALLQEIVNKCTTTQYKIIAVHAFKSVYPMAL